MPGDLTPVATLVGEAFADHKALIMMAKLGYPLKDIKALANAIEIERAHKASNVTDTLQNQSKFTEFDKKASFIQKYVAFGRYDHFSGDLTKTVSDLMLGKINLKDDGAIDAYVKNKGYSDYMVDIL